MVEKRLSIHIGAHKTATTSLQAFPAQTSAFSRIVDVLGALCPFNAYLLRDTGIRIPAVFGRRGVEIVAKHE
jgi:hypothetical protein